MRSPKNNFFQCSSKIELMVYVFVIANLFLLIQNQFIFCCFFFLLEKAKSVNGCRFLTGAQTLRNRYPGEVEETETKYDLLPSTHLCQGCTLPLSPNLHLCNSSLPPHRFYPPSSILHNHHVVLACWKYSAKCC